MNMVSALQAERDAQQTTRRMFLAAVNILNDRVEDFEKLVRSGFSVSSIRKIIPKKLLTVTIVDDDRDWVYLVVEYLENAGYDVVWSSTDQADELARILASITPDIVLCDHFMPRLTDLEVIETVKVLAPNTPCVMLTGVIPEDYEAAAARCGAADWVCKNEIGRLVPIIERELGRV